MDDPEEIIDILAEYDARRRGDGVDLADDGMEQPMVRLQKLLPDGVWSSFAMAAM